MITKFKIYENNTEPKIGDYVVCQDLSVTNHSRTDYKLFSDFISKNAGQIVGTDETHEFFVSYESVPKIHNLLEYAFFVANRLITKNFKYKIIRSGDKKFSNVASFKRSEIIFFGDIDTVESYIESQNNIDKYNL